MSSGVKCLAPGNIAPEPCTPRPCRRGTRRLLRRSYWCRFLWKNIPPETKRLGKIGLQSTKTGGAEQCLPLDCRAKAGLKGMFSRVGGVLDDSTSLIGAGVRRERSLCADLDNAIQQQQQLLATPRFGVSKAHIPTRLLIRRSVFVTDTGSVSARYRLKSRVPLEIRIPGIWEPGLWEPWIFKGYRNTRTSQVRDPARRQPGKSTRKTDAPVDKPCTGKPGSATPGFTHMRILLCYHN